MVDRALLLSKTVSARIVVTTSSLDELPEADNHQRWSHSHATFVLLFLFSCSIMKCTVYITAYVSCVCVLLNINGNKYDNIKYLFDGVGCIYRALYPRSSGCPASVMYLPIHLIYNTIFLFTVSWKCRKRIPLQASFTSARSFPTKHSPYPSTQARAIGKYKHSLIDFKNINEHQNI